MTALTSKGQATIPAPIRAFLGVRPGDQIEFVIVDGTVVVRKGGGATAYDRGQHLFGQHRSAAPDDPGSSRACRKSLLQDSVAGKHG
ncbi:MAG: AbrB/MazE/SpoVT family DNA-binding domain-containing protein [Lamprobacter sp.]|uniref:AbrB/MazE/SpoVT family DNA-binding domain-containing protein n=1 Tax=Lamprobacter sp. TaxID=3100796 RepID=UPI002B25FF25|nr:AbrB/MazE/SpoVT family DNA-binding domain-containing protein [Lamprobacter sp.]MEA3642665.1 AbrB/MazE/SpoVT family DNA-binding domain-containing protein [Lamprobacter sp.]